MRHEQKVVNGDKGTHQTRHRCSQCSALQPHAQGKDRHPVEHYVEQRTRHIGHHGIFGRTIEADDKQPHGRNYRAHQRRQHPQQVVDDIWHQALRTSKQKSYTTWKRITQRSHRHHSQRTHHQRLGAVDACCLYIVVRQMYGRHDAGTSTKHQGNTHSYLKQRSHDIDSSQTVATHTLAHKEAVGHRGQCPKQQTHECGDKQLHKQSGDLCPPEIYGITIHCVICGCLVIYEIYSHTAPAIRLVSYPPVP